MNLIEKIVRTRVQDSVYWKESCFGLSAETLVDKAVELVGIGGQYGNQKPTEFLCLALRLLQLRPDFDIICYYIQQEDFKYLRALGAFYLRLVGKPVAIHTFLEPLLNDKRKLRLRNSNGFLLTYMDEFADQLLREDRICDTILPRMTRRHVLEELKELEPRISLLEDELDDEEDEEEVGDNEEEDKEEEDKEENDKELERQGRKMDTKEPNGDLSRHGRRKSHSRSRSRSREHHGGGKDRSQSRDRHHSRRHSRSRSRDRQHRRRQSGRSRSRDRHCRRHRDDSTGRSRSRTRRKERSRSRDRRRSPSQEKASSSKNWSKKKVNGLFKHDKSTENFATSNRGSSSSGGGGGGGGGAEGMSIEETNKIRISLGLKPLKV